MTRRNMISVGLVLAMAGSAFAAERTRSSRNPGDTAEAVARPAVERLAGGLGTASFNGQTNIVNADGSVAIADIVKEHGSVNQWKLSQMTRNIPMSHDAEGNSVFANGVMLQELEPATSELSVVEPTIEYAEANEYLLARHSFDGVEANAFANGMVFNISDVNWSAPGWFQARQSIPSVVNAAGEDVFANGAVFFGAPVSGERKNR